MSKTVFNTHLSGLSDDFFMESLQYEDARVLRQLLECPPQKIEDYQIRLRHYTINQNDEEFEQIKAYAPKRVIEKLLETAKEYEPMPVYDKHGNIVEYL